MSKNEVLPVVTGLLLLLLPLVLVLELVDRAGSLVLTTTMGVGNRVESVATTVVVVGRGGRTDMAGVVPVAAPLLFGGCVLFLFPSASHTPVETLIISKWVLLLELPLDVVAVLWPFVGEVLIGC